MIQDYEITSIVNEEKIKNSLVQLQGRAEVGMKLSPKMEFVKLRW